MAEQGALISSRIQTLRDILPDLQTAISPFPPAEPKEFMMWVPIGENKTGDEIVILGGDPGKWHVTIQGKAILDYERIRFHCILRSIGPEFVQTPARISWEITLGEKVSQQLGKKTRFFSLPLNELETHSDDFLEIRLRDLEPGMITNDKIKCQWKVSLDWVCKDTLVDTKKKSILALHLITDAVETFEDKYMMLEKQQLELENRREQPLIATVTRLATEEVMSGEI